MYTDAFIRKEHNWMEIRPREDAGKRGRKHGFVIIYIYIYIHEDQLLLILFASSYRSIFFGYQIDIAASDCERNKIKY